MLDRRHESLRSGWPTARVNDKQADREAPESVDIDSRKINPVGARNVRVDILSLCEKRDGVFSITRGRMFRHHTPTGEGEAPSHGGRIAVEMDVKR